MSVYYNPETYKKIIRDGKECWVYDWGKNMSIDKFNYMLDRWEGENQRFYYNGDTQQFFLINKQERLVMEIINTAVVKFLSENIYMANINETFIELFTLVGGFKETIYE